MINARMSAPATSGACGMGLWPMITGGTPVPHGSAAFITGLLGAG